MNHRLLVPVLLLNALLLGGCNGFTIDVGSDEEPRPGPGRLPEPDGRPDRPRRPVSGPYAHLPQRRSFSPKANVELKEGCYAGDFVLGRSQISVKGAGIGKTVIHGNLVLQTQCEVSCLTVLGDVIFEGNQGELVDADFFGRIIDKGVQNTY